MIFDGPQKSDCELISSSLSTFDILNGDDGVKIIFEDCDLVMFSLLIFDTAADDDFIRNFVDSDTIQNKLKYRTI